MIKIDFKKWSDQKICLAFFLMALLICLPTILFREAVPRDTAHYYGAMIREFSSGNFSNAYYHMIPPLFPTVAGMIAATFKFEPFMAAKITSSLFFALTTFPLFFLIKHVFDRKNACISTALFIVCYRLIRYAGTGGIDTTKMFFLMSTTLFSLQFLSKRTWKSSILTGASCAAMILTRAEGIGMAILFITGISTSELWQRRFPIKSLASVLTCAVILAPWIAYEYHMTGYPVTDSRQIALIEKIAPKSIKSIIKGKSHLATESEIEQLISSKAPRSTSTPKQYTLSDFSEKVLGEIYKGLYPLYLIPALIVIYWRIRKKRWAHGESILLILSIMHIVILLASVGGTWTQKRYVIQAMPLLLGWTAIALMTAHTWCASKNMRTPLTAGLIIFISIGIWRGNRYARPESSKRKAAIEHTEIACADWLRNEGSLYLSKTSPKQESTMKFYANGRPMKLLSHNGRIPFLANAECVKLAHYTNKFTPETLSKFCQLKHIDFLILSDKTIEENPGLKQLAIEDIPPFKTYFSTEEGESSCKIIGYEPNLLPTQK